MIRPIGDFAGFLAALRNYRTWNSSHYGYLRLQPASGTYSKACFTGNLLDALSRIEILHKAPCFD